MDNETKFAVAAVIASIGALFAGATLLVTAWSNRGTVLAGWVLVLFQVVLAVVSAAFMVLLVSWLISWLTTQLDSFQTQHVKLARELSKRFSPAIAMIALVIQAVLVIAGEAFKDKSALMVSVTLLLIILFFCANELLIKDSKPLRAAGWAIWIFAICALPFYIWMDRGFDIRIVLSELHKIDLSLKIALGLGIPVLFVVPFALTRR